MATAEAVPPGPSPEQEEAAERAAAEEVARDPGVIPLAARSPMELAPKSGDEKLQPEDVKPWGRGRLHLPVIHSLNLDAEGIALEGHSLPTGFSVVIPNRKAKGSTEVITKRDERIARVTVENDEQGAKVTFRFRGAVPAYRVRLRGTRVEFLISADETP